MLRVKVTGLREIEKRLGEIEKSTTRKTVARNALRAGGKVIVAAAARRAPVDTGALAAGIQVSTKLNRDQKSAHRKRDPVEVFAGAKSGSDAVAQEFGTPFHAPQPFMRPAYDGNKKRALRAIVDYMRQAVDRAIERQARKRAAR